MDTPVLQTAEGLAKIREDLAAGRSSHLVVTGGSMVPFLRHKKSAVILTAPRPPYRRGEILLYLRGPEWCILHRLVRVKADGTLVMCGDAQTALECIRPEQVVAQVSHVRHGAKITDCRAWYLRAAVAVWMALRWVRRPLLAAMVRLRRAGKN